MVYTFIPALVLSFLERLLTDGPGAGSNWRFDQRRPGWHEVAGVQVVASSPCWRAPRDGAVWHDEWLDLLLTRLAPYLPHGVCYSTVGFFRGPGQHLRCHPGVSGPVAVAHLGCVLAPCALPSAELWLDSTSRCGWVQMLDAPGSLDGLSPTGGAWALVLSHVDSLGRGAFCRQRGACC